MQLTIGIKALNEELTIGSSIASALEAARPFNGEVILADCGSTDRTVEIAKTFSVRIMQLARIADGSCGAGAQLAFQHSRGDYFYLLDGDMILDREFLPSAIRFLEDHPSVAGVGGILREMSAESYEARIRLNNGEKESQRHFDIVDRLDGGGLYRASAVRACGYFADRNLHAFEEFDLSARLQSKGWKLARVNKPAVSHFGYPIRGYALLWRRIKSGYSRSTGEVLRAAVGKGHLRVVLRRLTHVYYSAAVIAWWGLLVAACADSIPILMRAFLVSALLLGPVAWLSVRRRSLSLGLYCFVGWNVSAVGLLSGLLAKRVPPSLPLESVEISSGSNANLLDPCEGQQEIGVKVQEHPSLERLLDTASTCYRNS